MFCEHNPGLNAMNAIINEALKSAMSAVHHLNDLGATVFGVEIRSGRPIIQIDGQPSPFLQGAMKTRRKERGMHRVVMVASVHGCQVEWNELYPVAGRELQA